MSRILVLEADEETRRCIHSALEANDLYVASCGDQETAIRVLRHFQPDLVIADWGHSSGDALCETIRFFEHYDHISVILTMYVLKRDVVAASSCMKDRDAVTNFKAQAMSRFGCDDFWAKPGSLERLIDMVAYQLAVADSRTEQRRQARQQ